MRFLLFAALSLAVPLHTTPVVAEQSDARAGSTLVVSFAGIETPKGNVMVALYDAAGWSTGKPVRVAMADASGTDPSTTITDLAPGRYGIKAFHDLDGDGKMGANPFGMPTEPFAFSNDALGEHGVPNWNAAAFEVAPGGTRLRITIR